MSPKKGEKIYYIPQTRDLGAGFKIRIKQIIPTKMKELHGDNYDGIWDIDTMTVYLNRNLPHKRKWFVYSHEYAHVVNDWVLWLVNNGVSQG